MLEVTSPRVLFELVEGLSGIGLGIAGSDSGTVRRDDDVMQRAGVDSQAGSVGESDVVAGDRPGAGLSRDIDIGDPAATCGSVYGEIVVPVMSAMGLSNWSKD